MLSAFLERKHHDISVTSGLCDCRFRGWHNCIGYALLFQRSLTFILRSEFQADESPCRDDGDLLNGDSHDHASLIVRDYLPREIVRNESHPDIRNWRFPHGYNWILDFVGSGYASEN